MVRPASRRGGNAGQRLWVAIVDACGEAGICGIGEAKVVERGGLGDVRGESKECDGKRQSVSKGSDPTAYE
jgi:hypothetical protein